MDDQILNSQERTQTAPQPRKSNRVAGWLGIFFGFVGAHRWYLGKWKKGVAHILLFSTILIPLAIVNPLHDTNPDSMNYNAVGITASIVYPIFIANILWGFIEGILLLVKKDSVIVAGLLGVFFGFTGAHNFYLNERIKGCIHLALSFALPFSIAISEINSFSIRSVGRVVFFLNVIWGIFEGIKLLVEKPRLRQTDDGTVTQLTSAELDYIYGSAKHARLIFFITIITLIATVIMRSFTSGLLTWILGMAYLVLFIRPFLFLIAGVVFAELRRKTTTGYVLFALLCLTSFLYALLFEDTSSSSSVNTTRLAIVPFANAEIALICFVASIIISIILIIYCAVKNRKNVRGHQNIEIMD